MAVVQWMAAGLLKRYAIGVRVDAGADAGVDIEAGAGTNLSAVEERAVRYILENLFHHRYDLASRISNPAVASDREFTSGDAGEYDAPQDEDTAAVMMFAATTDRHLGISSSQMRDMHATCVDTREDLEWDQEQRYASVIYRHYSFFSNEDCRRLCSELAATEAVISSEGSFEVVLAFTDVIRTHLPPALAANTPDKRRLIAACVKDLMKCMGFGAAQDAHSEAEALLATAYSTTAATGVDLPPQLALDALTRSAAKLGSPQRNRVLGVVRTLRSELEL
jgi:hypothetical protein